MPLKGFKSHRRQYKIAVAFIATAILCYKELFFLDKVIKLWSDKFNNY